MKEITAVLPVRNCRQQLGKCLKALSAGTVVPEIIVVDDGSGDGTAEMVKKHWPSAVYLPLSGHLGYAHAANAGLRLVRSEYAFLIRPDLCPGRSCIEKLLEAMRPDKGFVKDFEEGSEKGHEKGHEKGREKGSEKDPEEGKENAGHEGNAGHVFCAVPLFLKAEKEKMPQADPGEEESSKRGAAASGKGVSGKVRGISEEGRGAVSGKSREISAEGRDAASGKTRESSGRGRGAASGKVREILAVRDGCAMYSMKALEEIGWFDERHFDGLEALDLSLRGALYGYRTVEAAGAAVRPFARKDSGSANAKGPGEGWKADTFHRQLAAGNGLYVFYKNLPLAQRLLGLPLYALADLAQAASFAGHGELAEYRMALTRGRALCSLEKEKRLALDEGVSVYPENMADACFLGMSREAERTYPLFLAEKELFSPGRLLRYLHIQNILAGDLRGLIRLYKNCQ